MFCIVKRIDPNQPGLINYYPNACSSILCDHKTGCEAYSFATNAYGTLNVGANSGGGGGEGGGGGVQRQTSLHNKS